MREPAATKRITSPDREAYRQKLLDPRWQQKRLRIMERDEWRCQCCFDGDSTLNVHHLWYAPGADPWDYPDHALLTLCNLCHEDEHEGRKPAEASLLQALRHMGAMSRDVDGIATAFGVARSGERRMEEWEFSALCFAIDRLLRAWSQRAPAWDDVWNDYLASLTPKEAADGPVSEG